MKSTFETTEEFRQEIETLFEELAQDHLHRMYVSNGAGKRWKQCQDGSDGMAAEVYTRETLPLVMRDLGEILDRIDTGKYTAISEPRDLRNDPPEIVREELGLDPKRWYMWGRVCDRLAEGSRGVVARDLMQDGWIREAVAMTFLHTLVHLGVLEPAGAIIVGTTPREVRSLKAYRWSETMEKA